MSYAKCPWEKPDFREAMQRAREFVKQHHEPPITRREVYSVYRQTKSGNIVFRSRLYT